MVGRSRKGDPPGIRETSREKGFLIFKFFLDVSNARYEAPL